MNQKLIKVGSSVAAVIPKELLDDMGQAAGTRIAVELGELPNTVTIRFDAKGALHAREKRVLEVTDEFIAQYRKDLERLKDA
jgi:antitoxin component of MazEF toxin-antitoxin module